jgi:hypothetical protein
VDLFIAVNVTNLMSKIPAFGVGRQELVVSLRWKVEVSINVGATKLQIQQTVPVEIGSRFEDTRLHRNPVHRVVLETILASLAAQL